MGSGGEGSSIPRGLFWGRCCRYNLCSPQLAPMGGSCREAYCVSVYTLFNTQSYPLMDRLPQVIVSSLSPEVHKQKADML